MRRGWGGQNHRCMTDPWSNNLKPSSGKKKRFCPVAAENNVTGYQILNGWLIISSFLSNKTHGPFSSESSWSMTWSQCYILHNSNMEQGWGGGGGLASAINAILQRGTWRSLGMSHIESRNELLWAQKPRSHSRSQVALLECTAFPELSQPFSH